MGIANNLIDRTCETFICKTKLYTPSDSTAEKKTSPLFEMLTMPFCGIGCRQHRISEGGKLSVIGDIGSFHLRCVFVESDIFSHRRDLILDVRNFTAVFIG